MMNLVLNILVSQCFFAASAYLIDILKVFLTFSLKRYSFSFNKLYWNYGIFIQSLIACILFFILGWILLKILNSYFKSE
jgi:hypothetical protein